MPQGRCSGCGETGPHKAVTAHVLQPCPDWVALYHRDPSAALDPVTEYARWVESGERDAERDQARQARVQATDKAREDMAGRFAGGPASILED
jgi:hypothetical protein